MTKCKIFQWSDFFKEDPLVGTYSAEGLDFSGIQAMAGWEATKQTYDMSQDFGDVHLEAILEDVKISYELVNDLQESIARKIMHIELLQKKPPQG